jgi:hypothetical protein
MIRHRAIVFGSHSRRKCRSQGENRNPPVLRALVDKFRKGAHDGGAQARVVEELERTATERETFANGI